MIVNKNEIRLVIKHGEVKKIYSEGYHFVFPVAPIFVFNKLTEFIPPIDFLNLKDNKELVDLLQEVEVKDGQLCLCFREGLLFDVLKPKKHYFWKSPANFTFTFCDLANPMIINQTELDLLSNPMLKENYSVTYVGYNQAGALFYDNKFIKILSAGTYYFWKGFVNVTTRLIEISGQLLEVSGQELMTKDKITLRVNFTAMFNVIDPQKALTEVSDYKTSLYTMLQLALREYIGLNTLENIMEKRIEISKEILGTIQESAEKIGLTVNNAGIKDIILPGDIKEIINQVLIAEKKAQANVIMRREETASTRSLLNTAKLIEDNEVLMKLKELEYIEKIVEKIAQINLNGGKNIIEELKDLFIKK